MAAKLYNLARVTTPTTGTGTLTLGGAVAGFLTFAQAGVSNGDVVAYAIRDGVASEIGYGTYTSASGTLTRTVRKSTNSDAAISLSGNAEVVITPSAEDLQSDIALADGTAAAPSLAFYNDDDTGLFRVGSNSLGFAAGGDQQLRVFSEDGTSGGITQPRVGGLWTDSPNFNPTPVTGVNIARFERVLVGAACDNDGTKLGGGEWLEAYDAFVTGSSELAVVANSGRSAFVAAVRSSDNDEAGDNNIAGSFYAVNNNTSFLQVGYGIYVEAFRSSGAGAIHGMEIDASELGTSQTITPYTSSFATMSNALWLASGGGEAGATDASLALGIVDNGAQFRTGIMFGDNAIDGTDGSTGTGEAIAFAKGHKQNWYYTGGNVGFTLYSDVSASTDKQTALVDSNGVSILNNSDLKNFRVAKVAGTVTGSLAVSGSTGADPSLLAEGSATDIAITLTPKGSGAINLDAGTINTGASVSTGDAGIEIGSERTGSGAAYMDLHATSGSDFESRWLRQSGANGNMVISNTGTGQMQFTTLDASANIQFLVNSAESFRADSTGLNMASGKTIRVNSTQVVTSQQSAIASLVWTYTANDPNTVANSATTFADGTALVAATVYEAFDEIEAKINAILGALRTHGLIAT